jgi:hypothetical protein
VTVPNIGPVSLTETAGWNDGLVAQDNTCIGYPVQFDLTSTASPISRPNAASGSVNGYQVLRPITNVGCGAFFGGPTSGAWSVI